jgi:hypothetical protein
MSIVTLKSVDCDECGRGSSCLQPTAAKARKVALEDGWTYHDGKDYCPDCEVET